MPERAQRVGRVVVARTEVHLRADSLCRPRWVQYAVAVPEHVVAYRIGVGWGLPVTGTVVEGDAWEAAARTNLDEVSGALEELYRAHGGRTVRLDLVAEERRWRELSYPLSWPGWQRRWARRSKRAQREFVDWIGRAAQVYGPVRAEVARRYEEVHAEREAQKRALAEGEELRRQERVRRDAPFRQVADGCSWTYRGHFRVSRVDVPSSDEAETYGRTPSKPLSTSSLESSCAGSTSATGRVAGSSGILRGAPRWSGSAPVGAENPVMSCDLDILVDEAAEAVSSQRPDDRCGSWSSGALGRALLK